MFEGLVGQKAIKDRLAAQLLRDRLKHAYLFYGEAGMGKRAFAAALAAALLCAGGPAGDAAPGGEAGGAAPGSGHFGGGAGETALGTGYYGGGVAHAAYGEGYAGRGSGHASRDAGQAAAGGGAFGAGGSGDAESLRLPCRACAPCRLFRGGALDDYICIDTKARSISIDEIRRVIGWVSVRPMVSRRKVYVIADADKMTEQAQNALLKTLEDPPPYVHAVLTASRPEALLETIRSRCEAVRFARYGDDEIRRILADRQDLAWERELAGRQKTAGRRAAAAAPPSRGAAGGAAAKSHGALGGALGGGGSYGGGAAGEAGGGEAAIFVRLAGGVPGKAIEMAQSEGFAELRGATAEHMRGLILGRPEAEYLFTEFLEKQKSDCQKIADIVVHMLRDLWIRSVMGGGPAGAAAGAGAGFGAGSGAYAGAGMGAGAYAGAGAERAGGAALALQLPLPADPQKIPECIEAIEGLRAAMLANANYALAANMMAMKVGELCGWAARQ